MTAPTLERLNQAYLDVIEGRLDRRALLLMARSFGISAGGMMVLAKVKPAFAQDASPVASPAADLSYTSITAAEAEAQLLADFPMSDAATTGGTVILGNAVGLSTTNVALSADFPTQPLMAMVNEPLLVANPKDAQWVPGLAEQWEIAPDGKTYTFHLRRDVTWHDGTPFTADDVIFSMDMMSAPDSPSLNGSSFAASVASHRKIDDYTVEAVASSVAAQVVFLTGMNLWILPKHIWEGVPYADWKTDGGSTGEDPSRVVGTGAIKLTGFDISTGVATFERFDDYYGKVPYLDKILLQTWPDLTTSVEALRAGQVDVILGQVPPTDANSLKDEPGFTVGIYDTNALYFLSMNLDPAHTTLFEDVRTRQALAYALDRQSVVDNLLLGYGEVAQGSQATLSIAYAPDKIQTHYDYNPEKAKQLLADAGWTDEDGDGVVELNGQKLAFSLVYGGGEAFWGQHAAYIQEAYAAIGAAMTPEPVDFSTVLLPIIVGTPPTYDYEMLGTSFGWDFSGDQSGMFGTAAYEVGFNFMKYSNPDVDKLYEQASLELDPEKRIGYLVEATNLVNEDIPMNVLIFIKQMTAYSSRLQNYTPNYTGGIFWSLPYVWLSES